FQQIEAKLAEMSNKMENDLRVEVLGLMRFRDFDLCFAII
ncbi:1451_t:CDS:1, partial [Entrophospora sp. SA101]